MKSSSITVLTKAIHFLKIILKKCITFFQDLSKIKSFKKCKPRQYPRPGFELRSRRHRHWVLLNGRNQSTRCLHTVVESAGSAVEPSSTSHELIPKLKINITSNFENLRKFKEKKSRFKGE